MRNISIILSSLLAVMEPNAAEVRAPDAWLTNAPALPAPFTNGATDVSFGSARAEAIAGQLRISWEGAPSITAAQVITSADAPGHWPARDWRTSALRRSGNQWLTEVPVDSLDVPLIYFLVASNGEKRVASPMRIAWPGALGLEQPTRIFWPFIEGFEQGLEGWRNINGSALRVGSTAKHGRSALVVQIPQDQRSVTITTTRLRGWLLQEHRATGAELWLRTGSGTGLAAFDLMANAFSTNQVLARCKETARITTQWTRVQLRLWQFGRFPLHDLDLFSIELTGEPGAEFFLDDVQLLGPWRLDL